MKLRTHISFGLIMALALVASAQTFEVPAMPIDGTAKTISPEATLSLNLMAAYEMALSRNMDLHVARYGIAASDFSVLQNTGIFDPQVGFEISGNSSESPAATQLDGADIQVRRSTTFGFDMTQMLPTGTTFNVTGGFTRSESNSTFVFINPNWGGDLTASVTQPLLDGFGTLVNRSGIVIAQNAREQGLATFKATVIATLQSVENAYWDYIKNREAVEVKQQSLDLATRLLNETRERVKVGTSAPIDLVQSEAGVATRLQELIYARNAAANAEDTLKAVLGFDTPDEWMASIDAVESYEAESIHPDLRQAINTGLEKRPEIVQKRLDLEQQDLRVKLARNSLLPNLDLTASYGFSGVGGTLVIRDRDTNEILGTVPGGFSDAWKQMRDRDFPHWTMKLTLQMPIGNNDAKAQLAQRRFEYAQKDAELDALRQQIIRDVRTAVRALEDGAAAVDAAVASRDFAQRNLEAEQTKFDNGLSTNYQVLEIQEDLAQAQLSELEARINYRKAMAGYLTSTGMLLSERGIRVEDPEAPPVPHSFWADVKWLQFIDLKDAASRIRRPAEPAEQESSE